MINPIEIFMAKIRLAIVKKQLDLKVSGFYKSGDYVCPSVFYNHRSRTFLKNKRKGL